jgi:hypothetical protein
MTVIRLRAVIFVYRDELSIGLCFIRGTSVTLVSLLFSNFINDLCVKINYSKFILLPDDFKICQDVKSVGDREFLQVDIDSVQQRCGENREENNGLMSVTCKTKGIHFNFSVSGVSV